MATDSPSNSLREGAAASAQQLLTARFGGPVRIDSFEPLDASGRSNVFRCRLGAAPAGSPSGVILKQVQGDEEHPYDPEDAERFHPAWRFFNDWSGAEILTEAGASLAPRFFGGDRALGFILLEDLGPGESLAELLRGSDPAAAREGLLALARVLGRMHAATAGKTEEYVALRSRLGPTERRPVSSVREDWRRAREVVSRFEVPVSAHEDAELESVVAELSDPGPFLAFTHGDPCPDNNRWENGEMRLLDFEFGQLRHALTDGAYGRIPFPTCWCIGRLPAELPAQMETVYRAELVAGVPEAADDGRFNAALVAACASWTIGTMLWHLERALEQDHQWGLATLRQRIVFRLEELAATTAEFNRLPALGAACAALAERLRAEWGPEAEIPIYPAFATK